MSLKRKCTETVIEEEAPEMDTNNTTRGGSTTRGGAKVHISNLNFNVTEKHLRVYSFFFFSFSSSTSSISTIGVGEWQQGADQFEFHSKERISDMQNIYEMFSLSLDDLIEALWMPSLSFTPSFTPMQALLFNC